MRKPSPALYWLMVKHHQESDWQCVELCQGLEDATNAGRMMMDLGDAVAYLPLRVLRSPSLVC